MRKGKIQLSHLGKITTFLFAVVVFVAGWVGYTSLRYDLSFGDVTKSSIRYVALTAVSLGVNIYDPSAEETIKTKLGPLDAKELGSSIVRIEEYLKEPKQKGLALVEVKNEKIITSHYDFSYQPDVPRLREMRERMGLDKIVKDAADDLEKMVRLRQWVREQFGRKDYQKTMVKFDALTVWDNPQKNSSKRPAIIGVEYMPCHFFPLFYSQVMLSMGFNARVVHVSTSGYGFHGFTEVWSNQYGKWISMDPDLNLHYIKNGVPLNMREVHESSYASQNQSLEIRQVIVEPGIQPEETARNMMDYHRYIEIADLRNDWLTNSYFRGHPKRSDMATLTWKDSREPEIFRLSPATNNVEDMYWSLNQVEIYVQPEKTQNDIMALHFNTVTPNFSYFEIDDNGDLKKVDSSSWVWRLKAGENKLSVTPVNSFGVTGITSWIEIVYDVEQSN